MVTAPGTRADFAVFLLVLLCLASPEAMSGVTLREACSDRRMGEGDAPALSRSRPSRLLQYPAAAGDVDGDWGLLASLQGDAPSKRTISPATHNLNHGAARHPWLEALERLREWLYALLEALGGMFLDRLPTARGIDGLVEQARGGSRSVASRLGHLRETARGRAVSWRSAAAQRASVWSQWIEEQRELGPVLAADLWAEWRRHLSLSWSSVLRPFLLQLTTALGRAWRSSRTAWTQSRPRLASALRTYRALWWSWLTQRLVQVAGFLRSRRREFPRWQSLRDSLCRERPAHRLRMLGCSLRSFSLSRRDVLVRCCQDFCRCDRDWRMYEDILFVCEEPQVKALVATLLFAFAVLAEVVAASYMPVLCAACTAAPEVSVQDVMASCTLSHSVLTSLKGAAAVM